MGSLSPTGLPLCPTCGRLASQHTNPVAHAFGEPYRMVRDRPARSGGERTDFGRHFRQGMFVRGCSKPVGWWRLEALANNRVVYRRILMAAHDALDEALLPDERAIIAEEVAP